MNYIINNLNYKALLIFSILTILTGNAIAQDGTLIDPTNSQTRQNSAALEVYSTNQGFLTPRIALTGTADAATVTGTEPNGLLVYNTATAGGVTPGFYYWNGSSWTRLLSGSSNLSGAGTLNYVTKWTPDGATLGNSQIFDNGTNIGIGTTVPGDKLDIIGNVNAVHLEQGPLVVHPKATWSVGGGSTGAVIIKLPGTIANYGMLHMEINVYEYGATGATTYIIGGHNWNGQWYNYSCQTIGSSTKKVRLAVKDNQYAIVIGETGSPWSYGHVVLSKITNGGYYSGIIDLGGTYTVYQDNAAESYTWITGDLNSSTNPTMTTNYIQNQVAADQPAGFRINGNGLFNGGSVGIGSLSPGWKLDVNGNARIGANTGQNTLAALAVSAGQGSGTTFRDIDLHGNWSAGEGHAISASHATGANNLVGQIVFEHNSPGSRIKFGRLYHSGDQTTYPMELVSNGSNAILRMNNDAYTYYGPNSSWGAYLQVGGNGRVTTSASVAATNGNLHIDAADGGYATYVNYYSQNPTYVNAQAGNIGLGTTSTFDKVTVNGRIRFGTNDVSYTNPGTGATFGTGDPTQGIGWGNQPLDEYGIWVAPQENVMGNYTRLILGWHTGVKIGGSSGYGGTRFYNNSPVYAGSNATEIFSVGNGDNNVRAIYGMYSPIYYDYNDASYYVDPNGTSEMNLITSRTRATMGNSGLYNTPRHQITGDTRYWTGSMGWGTTDLNDVANWGSGFFDSWSSPGNSPGTTSHYVGHQAFHFAGGGTYNYGYQMVSTTNANRWHLRSNWNSGWSPWVEMITTGNATSLYPNINGDNLGNHSATTTLSMNGNLVSAAGKITFSGVGGNSGQGNDSYAIYQEGGAWSHPYPDLCIGYHTGIKLGAHWTYGGTRFYNNSDMATLLFSVGDGDQNVRVANSLGVGAYGWMNSTPTSYGSLALSAAKNGYYGILMGQGTGNPNFMWDGGGNGGVYFENYGWMYYYLVGSRHLNINTSSDLGATLGVAGNIVCTTIRSNGFIEPSDERLKNNITPISGALDKVKQIQGVTYNWNKELEKNKDLDEGTQYGVIAQELEKILPELVTTDENDENCWKAVNYSHLVPVLIEALKEQQTEIETQKATITAQQKTISGTVDDITFLKQYTKELEAKINTIAVDKQATGNK